MHALIDPSVSHSFVNPDIVLTLGLVVSSLECLLLVSGPKYDLLVIGMICYACPVMFKDRYFLANLVVFELIDFDVILGMDWFSANYATLDYRSKIVEFRG